MPVLDDLVIGQIEEKILVPERLEVLLSALIGRAKNRGRDDAAKAQQLRKALTGTEGKIERLYGALAEGTSRTRTCSANPCRGWKPNGAKRCISSDHWTSSAPSQSNS